MHTSHLWEFSLKYYYYTTIFSNSFHSWCKSTFWWLGKMPLEIYLVCTYHGTILCRYATDSFYHQCVAICRNSKLQLLLCLMLVVSFHGVSFLWERCKFAFTSFIALIEMSSHLTLMVPDQVRIWYITVFAIAKSAQSLHIYELQFKTGCLSVRLRQLAFWEQWTQLSRQVCYHKHQHLLNTRCLKHTPSVADYLNKIIIIGLPL